MGQQACPILLARMVTPSSVGCGSTPPNSNPDQFVGLHIGYVGDTASASGKQETNTETQNKEIPRQVS